MNAVRRYTSNIGKITCFKFYIIILVVRYEDTNAFDRQSPLTLDGRARDTRPARRRGRGRRRRQARRVARAARSRALAARTRRRAGRAARRTAGRRRPRPAPAARTARDTTSRCSTATRRSGCERTPRSARPTAGLSATAEHMRCVTHCTYSCSKNFFFLTHL